MIIFENKLLPPKLNLSPFHTLYVSRWLFPPKIFPISPWTLFSKSLPHHLNSRNKMCVSMGMPLPFCLPSLGPPHLSIYEYIGTLPSVHSFIEPCLRLTHCDKLFQLPTSFWPASAMFLCIHIWEGGVVMPPCLPKMSPQPHNSLCSFAASNMTGRFNLALSFAYWEVVRLLLALAIGHIYLLE